MSTTLIINLMREYMYSGKPTKTWTPSSTSVVNTEVLIRVDGEDITGVIVEVINNNYIIIDDNDHRYWIDIDRISYVSCYQRRPSDEHEPK